MLGGVGARRAGRKVSFPATQDANSRLTTWTEDEHRGRCVERGLCRGDGSGGKVPGEATRAGGAPGRLKAGGREGLEGPGGKSGAGARGAEGEAPGGPGAGVSRKTTLKKGFSTSVQKRLRGTSHDIEKGPSRTRITATANGRRLPTKGAGLQVSLRSGKTRQDSSRPTTPSYRTPAHFTKVLPARRQPQG